MTHTPPLGIAVSVITFGALAWISFYQGRRRSGFLMGGLALIAFIDTVAAAFVYAPPLWVLALEAIYGIVAVIFFIVDLVRSPPAAKEKP